ncbi:ATP-binding cassette domain-containing protein [Aerococcus mictus]|uniref:ATP-binding cassette domain-containing protein n=1 Tax=Aerococcus mictus TaxID=2976810 RepID=UPI003A0FDF5A
MNGRIQVDNVSQKFGGVVVLDDVSLAVEPRQFISLIGPSGCGKTTLLNDNGCSAVTAISVYHTNVAGVSALFCVGTYEDTFVLTEESRFALAARKVTLDTRRLPFGSHIPM